jgi:hypothetical protein
MRPRAAAATLALTLLAHAGPAHADEVARPRDGTTATLLAVGGTVGGFALSMYAAERDSTGLGVLGFSATMVGPSLGHLYAGETGHALVTTAIRTAGIVTFAAAFGDAFCILCSDQDQSPAERRDEQVSGLIAFAGFGVYASATVYDLIDARHAARRANRRTTVATPTILVSPDGARAPGLVLGGSF